MDVVKSKLYNLIKTCVYCNKEYIKDISKGWGCCQDCYYSKEVMVCRQCGREISKFEFDDCRGLCYYCEEISEVSRCSCCGKEYIRTKDELKFDKCNSCSNDKSDIFICHNCNKEITKKEYLVNHGYCSICYSDTHECEECGKEVSPYEYILNAGCCSECRDEGEF